MYKKINVYVNGKYEFSTNRYKTCKEVLEDIRATKHITIASLPAARYLTVYDYDKVRASYK